MGRERQRLHRNAIERELRVKTYSVTESRVQESTDRLTQFERTLFRRLTKEGRERNDRNEGANKPFCSSVSLSLVHREIEADSHDKVCG